MSKIEVLKDPCPLNSKKNQDLMDADEMHDTEVDTFTVLYCVFKTRAAIEPIKDKLKFFLFNWILHKHA